jgi:hypothetical protein
MKFGFAFLFLLACPMAAWAHVDNLNTTSDLVDEGIENPPASSRLVTPNILDGVPLMQGLQPVQDKDLIILLPGSGNPNEVKAIGIVDVDDVYDFYKIAMPVAGWQASGARDYMRGSEILHINAQAEADGKSTTVTFTEHP